jgi:sugar-specific transcriptional regulator TrmB
MSDTMDIGPAFSPEENAYFESGGNSEIAAGDNAAGAGEGQDTGAGDGKAETADGQPKIEKMVSLAALHEERGRRKATESEKRALETQLAELRGKFSIIERLNAPLEKPAPTVDNDIFGVVKNTTETVAEIQKRLKAEDEQKRAEGERRNVVAAYQRDAAQFEAKTPDFKAAYAHLLNSRASELMAMGYDDPMQLHQALTNDEMAIAQMALGSRKSPAEIIYNLAQQRGYKKAEPGAKGANKIDTINRGQQANKSLANTGGSSGDGEMTGEMLLKMPMDEFEAWCSKNPAKAKRLMGG